MDDAAVLAEAAAELREIGLSDGAAPPDGIVTRVLDAYPVYDGRYAEHRRVLKSWIATHLRNVHPAGRKGLHNYNSQDHAMMTALLAVRNAQEGTAFDVWSVNTDQEYAEEGRGDLKLEGRLVPRQVPRG
jgi:protoporphyrinogen oxidase